MENATKALIMAGGILIGVLILALMITLFVSSRDLSNSYDESKQSEAIQQFNTNFTKYLGKDLTIHQVVTICNFARKNGVTITEGEKTQFDIKEDVDTYTNKVSIIKTYELKINEYSNGYISSIKIEE